MLQAVAAATNVSDPNVIAGIRKNVGQRLTGVIEEPSRGAVGESVHQEYNLSSRSP